MMKSLSGVIALLLWLFTAPAQAACGLPSSSASLGTVTSFAVNTTASSTTGNINVNCGAGSVLSLLSTNNITLSLSGASAPVASRGTLTLAGGSATDVIPVRLCTTNTCTKELTIGGTSQVYSSTQLVNLVGLLGGLNFTIPLTVQTVPGAVVAAGTYTGILNVGVSYRICTGIGIGGLCLIGSDQNGSGIVPLTVTMVITNDCTTITAPNVSFGSAPLVSSFTSINQNISVICTKGSTYTVGLSNGNNANGSVRNMASGANRLSYEIYKGTTSNRWGPTGSDRWSSPTSTSVSSDGLTRTFNYTASILSTQTTPAAGNYTDSVVVDLSF